MSDMLHVEDLVLVCRGARPPDGLRPLPSLFAKTRLRDALHGGGGPRLLAFAERLGVLRPRVASALELRKATEEAVRRIEEALELASVLAFERPAAKHAGPGVRRAPEPEKKEREVFRSALVVMVVDEAGKPVPGAEVAKDAAGIGPTKNDGGHVLGSIEPGTYKIEAVKEGYRAASSSVQVAPEQTAQVQLKLEKIVARLVWPAAGAAHKQYVNLDRDPGDKASGNVIQIQVGVVGGGKAGDKLYFKMDWDAAKVSKRNSPVRKVVGGTTAGWCPKSGTTVTLRRDGEEPIVEVDLGLAGGDEIKVSVGGTSECKDGSCTITTWRKLWYEVMAPDFMGLRGDLGAGHRARIDQLLLPCFIEYRVWKDHVFPEAAAPQGTVFTGAYFGAARKQYVLTDHTFTLYPAAWDNGKRPRSVGLKLCDKNYFNDNGVVNVVHHTFQTPRHRFDMSGSVGRCVLPFSANDGSQAIKRIRWIAQINAAANPAHPAVHGGAPRSGVLGQADVTFVDITHFEVRLPAGTAAAPGPGAWVGPAGPATCPIRVVVEVEGADEALGLSGQGAQQGENLVCYKDAAPQTTVDVVIHEFCHSAGMAALGGNTPPPGIPQPKTTADVDPDNQCSVSTHGHLYTGHGHSGGHCARGLNDAQKAQGLYGRLPGTCINFGENDLNDPSQRTDLICKTCAIILKARELQAI